jgi:hypothetical protein
MLKEEDVDSFTEQATSILTFHEGKEAEELFEDLVRKTFKRGQ